MYYTFTQGPPSLIFTSPPLLTFFLNISNPCSFQGRGGYNISLAVHQPGRNDETVYPLTLIVATREAN